MATITASDLLNAVRSSAGEMYSARVPSATQENIGKIGDIILSDNDLQNSFINTLVNKIAMTQINTKVWSNPLAKLKSGKIPYGRFIENAHINPAKANSFDTTGSNLMGVVTPDVATEYIELSRQDEYKQTIKKTEMMQAFRDASSFMKMYNGIISTLYSGDNIDEYLLIKELIAKVVSENKVQTQSVEKDSPKDLMLKIRKLSDRFTIASDKFNGYKLCNPETGNARITFTEKRDQVLILTSDMKNEIDFNVLANTFNMEKAQLETNTITVDDFGTASNLQAIICDKAFFMIYDNFTENGAFYNPSGLFFNYFWHHWQTIGASCFANCVALVENATE